MMQVPVPQQRSSSVISASPQQGEWVVAVQSNAYVFRLATGREAGGGWCKRLAVAGDVAAFWISGRNEPVSKAAAVVTVPKAISPYSVVKSSLTMSMMDSWGETVLNAMCEAQAAEPTWLSRFEVGQA